MRAAVFLDRDGVLIEDVHLLTKIAAVRVLPNVPSALRKLNEIGFRLIVVSNQTIVARGLASECDVERVNQYIAALLERAGGPRLRDFYFCPHHPSATLPEFRIDCACRKPRPGMLIKAAHDHDISLESSFMIGDRISDIAAGARANCRTVLVQTGKHRCPAIETPEPPDASIQADHVCLDLAAAAEWIASII